MLCQSLHGETKQRGPIEKNAGAGEGGMRERERERERERNRERESGYMLNMIERLGEWNVGKSHKEIREGDRHINRYILNY